jgi:uncharacterized protein
MSTRGRSIRWLLFSLLSFVTIFAAVLVRATGDPALVVAARDGDFDAVRTLLGKRVDVNEPARDGSTALLWAVHNSDVRMARALIAAGANFTKSNRYGVTPLLEASRTGDTPMIA